MDPTVIGTIRGKYRNLYFAFFCVFIISCLLHLGTFHGLDSDFQAYSLFSKLIFNGQKPYIDFFTHKPPLYFYLLLPGNIIMGGKFYSFFAVHLFHIGVVNCLIFYFGTILTQRTSVLRGIWAWILFCLVTVIQFFNYGNLNGGIVYVSMGFNIIAFFLIIKIKDRLKQGFKQGYIPFAAGFVSSLSFLTRFGMAPNFIFLILIFYLFLIRRHTLKYVFKIALSYIAGFALPVILMLLILDFPFDQLYEYLIVFNSHYSQLNGLTEWIIERPIQYIITLYNYGKFIIIICAIALLLIIFIFFKENRSFLLKNLEFFRGESIALWIIIYFLSEFFMLILQGSGEKQYPFFYTFIPLAFLGCLSLDFLTAASFNKKKAAQVVLVCLSLIFLFKFGASLHHSKNQMISVYGWPESRLISEIKHYIKNENDLFTFGHQSYIYLETGTFPPKGRRNSYIGWRWNFFGKRNDIEYNLWKGLERNPPTVVTRPLRTPIPDISYDFLSKYLKIGNFTTSYAGDTELYILK